MNRIGEPIAKCIISTLISVTLFSCHMDKESAITLFEQGKKMEKRMLPDSAVIMYQMQKYDSALYYYTIGTQCDNLNTRTGCYYMLYKLSSLLNKPDSAYYYRKVTTKK